MSRLGCDTCFPPDLKCCDESVFLVRGVRAFRVQGLICGGAVGVRTANLCTISLKFLNVLPIHILHFSPEYRDILKGQSREKEGSNPLVFVPSQHRAARKNARGG